MTKFHRATAAAIITFLTLGVMAPASAAPSLGFDPRPTFPGWNPFDDVDLPPEPVESFPPVAVGELWCFNGMLIGDFTDPDQDDDTLRVFATLNSGSYVEYETQSAWGVHIWVPPYRDVQMNLTAVDEDGNETHHRAVEMDLDGTCHLYNAWAYK